MREMTVPASKFKTSCLKLMNDVRDRKVTVLITKRGKPIARLVPPSKKKSKTLFGFAKGTFEIVGDVLSPIDVE